MRTLILSTMTAAIALAAISPVFADEERTVRVQFDRGTTGTTITDRISGYESVLYKLNAREGQFLTVSLRPDNQSANFNIYIPGRGFGDEALYNSETGGHEYKGQLYVSGDHTVAVYLNRNAARRDEVANYDIVFEIGAAEESAAPAYSISEAESQCLAAVANQVGNGDVSTIGVEKGETSTMVKVRVPGAQAPWACEHGFRDGKPAVLRVYYTAEG